MRTTRGCMRRSTFDPSEDVAAPYIADGARPAVAILREQGVNSQTEMAAVFTRAGFDAYDVHMTDILERRARAWAGSTAWWPAAASPTAMCSARAKGGRNRSCSTRARAMNFRAFFERDATFTLGVCNGCQMLAALKELIPGAEGWPRFVRNRSEQYEARLVLGASAAARARCCSPACTDSVLPIVWSHGEGLAEFGPDSSADEAPRGGGVSLRYVDNRGQPTERYPFNPNGSPSGIAGVCSADGRVTSLMPHPERVFRTVQHSWAPQEWGEDGGWMRLFRNARVFAG